MANEQKQQIELITIDIDAILVDKVKDKNNELNGLVSSFGQIYLRKKELSEELIKLDEILEANEEQFKNTNKEVRELLSDLEKEYPRGQIDLEKGTLTYNPAIKEQMKSEVAGPQIVKE
jgi:hypothetical protein